MIAFAGDAPTDESQDSKFDAQADLRALYGDSVRPQAAESKNISIDSPAVRALAEPRQLLGSGLYRVFCSRAGLFRDL